MSKNKINFILFAILGVIMLLLHFTAGTIGTFAMATTAVAASSDEAIDYLKNALKGFDMSDPETRDALKNTITEGLKGSNDTLINKFDEVIESFKNTIPKVSENGNKKWYNSFLSEKENASDDKKEKRRLGFNRMITNVLRKDTLTPEMQNAMNQFKNGIQSEGTTTTGGFTVPVQTMGLIADDLRDCGIIMSEAKKINVNLPVVKIPTLETVGANLFASYNIPVPAYVTEAGSKPVSNYTFGITTFTMRKYAFIVPFTDELLEDSATDLEQYFRDNVKDYYCILLDNLLFRGDGQITGIYGLTTTYQITSGAGFSSVTYFDLINAMGKLRTTDMKNVKWYMSPSVWAHLHSKVDANGRPLLSEYDIKAKTLLGLDVILTDSAYAMSETAASKPFITLVNMNKVFLAMRKAMTVDKSNQASYTEDAGTTWHSAYQENLTLLRAEMRFDIQLPFPQRVVQIKTTA